MCRKVFYSVLFVMVLSLAGAAQAANNEWDDVSGNGLWNDVANWGLGNVPVFGDGDNVQLRADDHVTVQAAGMGCHKIYMYSSSLTIDGGELGCKYDIVGGNNAGDVSTITVNGGRLYVTNGKTYVGNKGTCTLNVYGGILDLRDLYIGYNDAAAVGHVNLHGGLIDIARKVASNGTETNVGFSMRRKGMATMDVTSGKLTMPGDSTATIQTWVDDAWITGYGGYGTVYVNYDEPNDITTLTAVHVLSPNPMDGSNVSASLNQLQWTLPEPNVPGGVVTCDVYFGTNPDIEANPKVVIGQAVESVPVTLASNTKYYWAVDPYDSSISTTEPLYLGAIFAFATMNTAPTVNAGDDIDTWLAGGPRVLQLDGVVSDEDVGPGPATLLWTVIAEPNELNPAQISDPLVANPTVTVIEPGTYTLQLEAGDGEFATTDTMQIVLYADSCEHAKNQEGFELIPGDINEDCIVDDLDLAILEQHWLESNYSTE